MKNLIILIVFLMSISCLNRVDNLPEEKPKLHIEGKINGEDFENDSWGMIQPDQFDFYFYVEDSVLVCEGINFSFRKIPLELGSYIIEESNGVEEYEASASISCGDLIFASYKWVEDKPHVLNVHELTSDKISGDFSINFELEEDIEGDYPDFLEIEYANFIIDIN